MPVERQPQPTKPLEFKITGSAEPLFQKLVNIGITQRKIHEKYLTGIEPDDRELELERHQVVLHQVRHAPEAKHLFVSQTILCKGGAAFPAGNIIYEPVAELQLNPELVKPGLLNKRAVVEKLMEEMERQGYTAKLNETSEKDSLGYSIQVDVPSDDPDVMSPMFIDMDERGFISISGGAYRMIYRSNAEYRGRIEELNMTLVKLTNLIEAFATALAQSFAAFKPVPETITITLPE